MRLQFLNRAACLAVLSMGAVLAQAQSTAGLYSGGGTEITFGGTTGWTFTVTESLTVTELGLLDLGDPGFAERHTVGIFDAANPGVSLVETILPAGTVATLIDGSRFQSVAPIVLNPGVTYYINADSFTVDRYAFGGGVSFAPEVTWNQYMYTNTTDIHDTPIFEDGFPGDLGPNFRFTTAPVPEPASIAAIAAGLGILARRRKRA